MYIFRNNFFERSSYVELTKTGLFIILIEEEIVWEVGKLPEIPGVITELNSVEFEAPEKSVFAIAGVFFNSVNIL